MDDLRKAIAELGDDAKIPTEMRVGSQLLFRALVDAFAVAETDPVAGIYGVPVYVDQSLPFDRVELRNRAGDVLIGLSIPVQVEVPEPTFSGPLFDA